MRDSRTGAIGFLYGATESRHPAMLGIRQATDGEDTIDCGSGIIRRIDLRRAHMQLAQPYRRIIGIKRHAEIVQEAYGKAKPAGSMPFGPLDGEIRRASLR